MINANEAGLTQARHRLGLRPAALEIVILPCEFS